MFSTSDPYSSFRKYIYIYNFFYLRSAFIFKIKCHIKRRRVFNNFTGPYWPAGVFGLVPRILCFVVPDTPISARYGPADCSECEPFCLFTFTHPFKALKLKSNSQCLLPYSAIILSSQTSLISRTNTSEIIDT